MHKNDSSVSSRKFVIGIVGPCGSGKTTLIKALKRYGLSLRHIAQEHSFVPNMWHRITNPDILIFLDASYPVTVHRRKLDWNQNEYDEEKRRLAHACQYANFYLFTDLLTPEQVAQAVLDFLLKNGVSIPPED
jgi:deoxyadenosine/deoxycytidine kinase